MQLTHNHVSLPLLELLMFVYLIILLKKVFDDWYRFLNMQLHKFISQFENNNKLWEAMTLKKYRLAVWNTIS